MKKPIFEKIPSNIGHQQTGFVERLDQSNLEEAVSFLMSHEDFSLFLLGNLERYGFLLTSSPNSGNFKLIRFQGKVVAVFCLTRRGNLLVQSALSDDWILEMILECCRQEEFSISGLLGEWSFCERFWDLFKKKGIIQKDRFVSKEILYTVDLEKQSFSVNPNVRLLTPKDYDQWKPLRIANLEEEGVPNDLSDEQLHGQFLEKVKFKVLWGYFLGEALVSMAELNAKAKDLGQVGGVYTAPTARRKGYSRSVMQELIKDARHLHKLRKLIIFTGETNTKARGLYESLSAEPSGYYALMFGV